MLTDAPKLALPAADLGHAVESVGASWGLLRGARVLMTGGTGFVGRWLIESLGMARRRHGLECSALILTRNAQRTIERWPWIVSQDWVQLVEADVRLIPDLRGPIRVILHGAVDTDPSVEATTIRDVCEQGVQRAIEVAHACDTEHFHLISSGAVYAIRALGEADPREIDPINIGVPGPYGAYADGKRVAEQIAHRSLACGCRLTVSRVFGLAGPGLPLDGRFAIGNFILDALSAKPIRVRGDGRAIRSYLHGADLAAWIWSIILRAAPMSVFNVGSPNSIATLELAQRVQRLLAPSAPIAVESDPTAPSTRYVPDVSAIQDTLGLRCSHSLDSCILGTARHYSCKGI